MIELNSKTQQDFLNRKWVQKLLDSGVDMSDAKYFIGIYQRKDVVFLKDSHYVNEFFRCEKAIDIFKSILPTYTVSELLYKLHEYIYPTIDGIKYHGALTMIKDAPFYIFYYELFSNSIAANKNDDYYIHAEFEYPIESLASLLIQCHQKGMGDTGNISDK